MLFDDKLAQVALGHFLSSDTLRTIIQMLLFLFLSRIMTLETLVGVQQSCNISFFFWTSYKVQLSSLLESGWLATNLHRWVAKWKRWRRRREWEFSGSSEDFCAGVDIQTLLFTTSGPLKLSFLLTSFPSCLQVRGKDLSARRLLIDQSHRQMGAKRRDSGGVGGWGALIKLSSFT